MAANSVREKPGLLRAIEVQDSGPLSFALGLPCNGAIQQAGDHSGRKVVVEVEEAGIDGFIATPKAERQMRRVVFGGEDQGGGVRLRELRGLLNLREGEVINGRDPDRLFHVA